MSFVTGEGRRIGPETSPLFRTLERRPSRTKVDLFDGFVWRDALVFAVFVVHLESLNAVCVLICCRLIPQSLLSFGYFALISLIALFVPGILSSRLPNSYHVSSIRHFSKCTG